MRDKTILDSAAFLEHFRSPNEYLLAPPRRQKARLLRILFRPSGPIQISPRPQQNATRPYSGDEPFSTSPVIQTKNLRGQSPVPARAQDLTSSDNLPFENAR